MLRDRVMLVMRELDPTVGSGGVQTSFKRRGPIDSGLSACAPYLCAYYG